MAFGSAPDRSGATHRDGQGSDDRGRGAVARAVGPALARDRCAAGEAADRHHHGRDPGARHPRDCAGAGFAGRHGEIQVVSGSKRAGGESAMSRTEQMTEFDERVVAEAEAELDRLLSIEPSPEFAAKVRARIAAEPPARNWNWGRLLVPVAAVAAVVIVVTLSSTGSDRGPEQPLATSRQNDIVLNPEKPTETPVIVTIKAVTDAGSKVRRVPVPEEKPEIIIDPAIGDAIRRLALAARSTLLDGSKGESIAAPNAESETLPVAQPLNVPELAPN